MTDNIEIDIRKTHPNLYWQEMGLSLVYVLLGLNFIFLHPTFLIFERPNLLWGIVFLVLGGSEAIFLNFYRSPHLVRLCMAFSVGYMLLLCLGATQPFLEGNGSLQNPILYLALMIVQIPLLREPFVNPWTRRK